MPTGVVFTKEQFLDYQTKMLQKGWELTNKRSIKILLDQLEAVPPYEHPQLGMEEGFTVFIPGKGMRATIWTTYVEANQQTRDGWDAGRILITESNKIVYYGPEIRRTDHYFERLLMWAEILKERIENRPICSHCGRLMRIRYTTNHQYYWYCEGFYL